MRDGHGLAVEAKGAGVGAGGAVALLRKCAIGDRQSVLTCAGAAVESDGHIERAAAVVERERAIDAGIGADLNVEGLRDRLGKNEVVVVVKLKVAAAGVFDQAEVVGEAAGIC